MERFNEGILSVSRLLIAANVASYYATDLHWVPLTVVIVANLGIVKVRHSLLMASVITSHGFHIAACKFQRMEREK